jgi:hypothetical protein
MTPEEKLSHLKVWINLWIDCRVSSIQATIQFFRMLDEYGVIFCSKGSIIDVITFDEYIQLIEKQKSNQ